MRNYLRGWMLLLHLRWAYNLIHLYRFVPTEKLVFTCAYNLVLTVVTNLYVNGFVIITCT
jgi:hypothetical protein